jgi:integrase
VPGVAFKEVAGEFLLHYQLYSEDQRTMPSQVRILERYFGDRPIDQITVLEIERFFRARLAEGIARPTLNRQASALSVFLEWCTGRGYRAGPNPALAVKRFKEGDGRDRYLTPEEAARLQLAALPHARPVITAALHTGGRLSEVLGLRGEHVDVLARVITFARKTTKGKMRRRHIPMSEALHQCLAGLPRAGLGDPVFTWRGAAMHDIRSSFERARQLAGLGSDVTFHTLRHTFGSWYVMNGGSLRVLQKLMGHRSIKTTERYSHLSPEHINASVRFIGPPGREPGTR